MRTDILGHPPSLCTYRRVWHPAIPTHPLRGYTCLKCTNQAATASSHSKRLLCVLWDNAHPNLLCVLCIPWENTIMAGCVGMAGMPYPPKCVLWAVHLCLVGAAETAAPPERTSVSICEICGRTPRTLTFYVFRGRTRTVCLSTRPSSTSEINDYGYAPGWRSQPKPIVLARHPSSRRGRPA